MNETNKPLFALFQLGNTIHQINKQTERRNGLSLVQWCVLNRLIDMPAAPAASLAKEVGVHPSTLTQTLRRLVRKKCVYIISDPKDSRKKMITITREGRDLFKRSSEQLHLWSHDLNSLTAEFNRIQSCLRARFAEGIDCATSL